jgi:hypothetical protein
VVFAGFGAPARSAPPPTAAPPGIPAGVAPPGTSGGTGPQAPPPVAPVSAAPIASQGVAPATASLPAATSETVVLQDIGVLRRAGRSPVMLAPASGAARGGQAGVQV